MSLRKISLPNALRAWQTDKFNAALQKEIESLEFNSLPLQQGLRFSSAVVDKPFKVMVLNSEEIINAIEVRVMVFYSGVIAGCSCADDPSPIDEQLEQCELKFIIEKSTGLTEVHLLD